MTALWIGLGLAVFWLLVRRRLFELWRDVQAARRQVDLQVMRRAELAPRLAEALADRLDAAQAAALRGDDEAARAAALASLPPPAADEPAELGSMRADLAEIEHRLAARLRVLAAENSRYRKLAPAAIGVVVGAPTPAALPPAALPSAALPSAALPSAPQPPTDGAPGP